MVRCTGSHRGHRSGATELDRALLLADFSVVPREGADGPGRHKGAKNAFAAVPADETARDDFADKRPPTFGARTRAQP